MILRESGTFAYKEGLIFEGELIHKGGKKMAFPGVFARPPRNSHEVLQPDAYINAEKLPSLGVPDLKQALDGQYDVFDSGGIGQLDVRAFLKQFGERKTADDISSSWQGGTYVTFQRKKAPAAAPATTADLALLYVSRWRTPQAAERFAHFYATAVALRYHAATAQPASACTGSNCPVSSVQIATEEGSVIVEHWGDNRVIVSESFDTNTASRVHNAVHDDSSGAHAEIYPQQEIAQRLYEIPAFRRFSEQIGSRIAQELALSPSR
jgi:hypothetical protein